MKARKTLLALGLMAAISSAANRSLAQIASINPATPIAASATTAVPALVPYSGVVIAGDGKTFAAESGITFQIYQDEAGGEALWTETQTVAIDPTGHYKVQLGATNPNGLPADLFANGEARWLEIQVAGEPAPPRVLIASVPYALKAADATTLGGLPASAFALARTGIAANASAGITSDIVSNVTTTGGTAGYLPEFSGATTVVDSPVFVSGANVGIGTATPTAVLDVNGTELVTGALTANGGETVGGTLEMAPLGTATATTSYDSQTLKLYSSAYNSTSKAAVNPRFGWQARPTGNNTAAPSGTLNLLSSNTNAAPAPTGFSFNLNGTINFATGQTFPGADITGVVNASGYNLGGSSFANGSASLGNGFFGFSGTSSATGIDNFGAGFSALSDLTTGNGNVAAGGYALHNDTTGSYNNAVGYGAAYFNTTGGFNAALGADALYFNTGSNNTGVGSDALFDNTSGSQNTALGAGAGPSSGALANATAIGYGSTVSQSNSLILGQTTAGSPGTSFVNVGIGTATPVSAMEISVSNTGAIGPTLTLTNPGGSPSCCTNPSDAIDFNTQPISTSGTYNPSARIEVTDDGGKTGDMSFLSNIYPGSGNGVTNNGLQTNMTVWGNGYGVSIGTTEEQAQLEVIGAIQEGVWAFGGTEPDSGMTQGLNGLRAGGGPSTGSDTGGIGAWLFGGDVSDGGTGTTGEGLLVWTGDAGGSGTVGLAADFEGDVFVDGTISANLKEFKIDHPLDPANKYLVHASVESSEMMNIYSGNVTTDELGLATVTMPDWFQAENTDFRYQLTIVDERFAQAVVSKRMENNQFTIHTNASNVQVSWQITAVRQDAYAKAHPVVVEQEKPANERGFYQNPELFGQPKEKQTEWGRRPKAMQQMKLQKARNAAFAQNKTNGGGLRHDQPATAVNRKFASPAPIIK
jgi:trimeric autotransporter adhesin